MCRDQPCRSLPTLQVCPAGSGAAQSPGEGPGGLVAAQSAARPACVGCGRQGEHCAAAAGCCVAGGDSLIAGRERQPSVHPCQLQHVFRTFWGHHALPCEQCPSVSNEDLGAAKPHTSRCKPWKLCQTLPGPRSWLRVRDSLLTGCAFGFLPAGGSQWPSGRVFARP